MKQNRYSFASLLISLLFAIGCYRGPKIVPVSGIVTIDGVPLKRGTVIVQVKDSRAAYGMIGPDGKFSFMTKELNGCIVGEHDITVLSREGVGPEKLRHLIPEKYSELSTSGLKIKVDEPTDKMEIKLTWEGSGHKEPYVSK